MPCNNARATNGKCQNKVCCSTGGRQDYADEIIKNIVLNGIYDHKIKHLVLAADRLYDKDIMEIIKNVKLHERAFSSMLASSPMVVAATAYKAQGKTSLGGGRAGGGDGTSTQSCGDQRCSCGNWYNRFIARNGGHQNKTAYTFCKTCFLNERK